MIKVYKGDIVFTEKPPEFNIFKDGYITVNDGVIENVSAEKPDNLPAEDFTGNLIIPSFTDMHVHAPQYPNIAMGYDEELLPWLNKYTFPCEARFENLDYAEKIYKAFINKLWECGSLHSIVFATMHYEASCLLFELFNLSGLFAYVGKVNMDRNGSLSLSEKAAESMEMTRRIVGKYKAGERVKPIITPRFVPSCTDELMEMLAELVSFENLPVQSHLDENIGEIEWVKELHPESESYAAVYDKYGMLGPSKSVMAHCVHMKESEKKLLKDRGTYIALCPLSNINLASGMAPVREYLDMGMRLGLGSDVSGGSDMFIPRSAAALIGVSKLYFAHIDRDKKPLSLSEAFYIATKGAGEFFCLTGSFEKGYYFDALVIDDEDLKISGVENDIKERLERFIYLGTNRNIKKRILRGKEIEKPF